MTSDDQHDRFDPMTGQPIDHLAAPAEPTTAATHRVDRADRDGIAPPGQTHADYDRRRTTPEPRDHILDLPQARSLTVEQRIAAKARARDAATISVHLPELDETVRVVPRSFDRVLADVSLTGLITPAAQRSFLEAARKLEAMDPDEQVRLGEDMDEVLQKLGIGGSQDFFMALSKTYPIACMVDPRCVPTVDDITGPGQIALTMLSHEDRAAIVNACFTEQRQRATAMAPFPDQAATA